jgi:thiamine biosynthesis lipoprotein ApbE
VPYNSSSGSGNGAAFDHRMPRAGGFCAPSVTLIATAMTADAMATVSIRFIRT